MKNRNLNITVYKNPKGVAPKISQTYWAWDSEIKRLGSIDAVINKMVKRLFGNKKCKIWPFYSAVVYQGGQPIAMYVFNENCPNNVQKIEKKQWA